MRGKTTMLTVVKKSTPANNVLYRVKRKNV